MDIGKRLVKTRRKDACKGLTSSRERSLAKLQKALKVRVSDISLFDRALTHRSYANENNGNFLDNERLEYLGDSVLGLIVNEYLFKRFENYFEGDLAKIKSTVVSEDVLMQVAHEIGIGEFILLGKGEENSGGRSRASILANTVEAVIGALYLDLGFKQARDCVLMLLKTHIERINQMEYLRDPKTTFQEYVQKKFKEKPFYEVTEEKGPDHKKEFTVKLVVNGKQILSGHGSSKRRAEMDAARLALEMMHDGSLTI